MRLSIEAQHLVDYLRQHYRRLKRPEALRNLASAIEMVDALVAEGRSMRAPRPYPDLARDGEAWVLSGRYWIAYSTSDPPVILGVYYDTANIPGRR